MTSILILEWLSGSQHGSGCICGLPGITEASVVRNLTTQSRYGINASCARALDGRLQLALMRRAGARDPARQHLAALRHEGPQQLDVLVVDVVDLVRAELADLPAPEQRAPLVVLPCRRRVRRGLPMSVLVRLSGRLPLQRLLQMPCLDLRRRSRFASVVVICAAGLRRGCRSGGRPRATRRRCESSLRRVRARSMTRFSSSTRTVRWRMTWSLTRSRRSISFISSPEPLITSRT